MNFRFKPKKTLKYILAVIISVAVFWVLIIRSNSRVSEGIFKISRPFVKAGNSIYLIGRSFFMAGKISRENSALYYENLKLIIEAAELKELQRENSAMKKMLGIPILKERKIIFADISGFNPLGGGGLIVINKGKTAGVAAGMPVISEEGALAGRIESLEDSFSRVLPIFSFRSSVASLSQDSRAAGIVKGSFGTSLVLDMVPQFDSISEGELLITSGIGGFPKGIPIGKIGEIGEEANNVFKKAAVSPLVDFYRLENVLIIAD